MMLLANLLLALMWASLIGPFTPANIFVGFLVGFVGLSLGAAAAGRPAYAKRAFAIVSLVTFMAGAIVQANLRVARQTLSSLSKLRPAVIAIPLEPDLADAEITLLSILITLTPGTLALDVASDRSALYVHFMHVVDVQAEIKAIKHGFERRIMEVMR